MPKHTTPLPKRLTKLPEDLLARGRLKPPPAYRYLREMAVNRVIPAHQVNNIWHYRPDDLDSIENALKQAQAIVGRTAGPVAA